MSCWEQFFLGLRTVGAILAIGVIVYGILMRFLGFKNIIPSFQIVNKENPDVHQYPLFPINNEPAVSRTANMTIKNNTSQFILIFSSKVKASFFISY